MITDYHAIYYAHELSRAGGSGKVARPSRSGSLNIGLDNQSLQISEGENLPHWTCDNAIYHVSFRLADSVPNSRRNEWLAERNSIEENAKALGCELTEEEKSGSNSSIQNESNLFWIQAMAIVILKSRKSLK